MTGEQFGGLVRALVAAAGGYFALHGVFDAQTWTAIGGAAAVVGAAIWSYYTNKAKA